jgi:mRNA interferase MazF
MTVSRSMAPARGEIWLVNFNSPITAPSPAQNTPQSKLPTTGDEIYKARPAVVMNIAAAWNLQLLIVVPITSWQAKFQINNYFWMVKILADTNNHLTNDSAANVIQVKSVSIQRFQHKIGGLTAGQMDLIAATIALCVGYVPPKATP